MKSYSEHVADQERKYQALSYGEKCEAINGYCEVCLDYFEPEDKIYYLSDVPESKLCKDCATEIMEENGCTVVSVEIGEEVL